MASKKFTGEKSHKHWYVFVLLVVIIIGILLEATNTTHVFHHEALKPAATTGGALTKGTKPQSPASANATDNTAPSANSTSKLALSSNTSATNEPLLTPWGTFANENRARLNDQMSSTCNTTSGAKCQIFFTNGSVTKSLGAENTDAGGAVYWKWTPSGIGLTAGTWHMSMSAFLGSQVKTSTDDPLTLEITQ